MDNWIFSRLISIACLLSNAVKRFDWNYWFRIHLLKHVNKPKQLALSSYLNSEQQLLNKWNNWMLRLALNAKIDRNQTCDQLTYSNGSWPFNHKIAMWREEKTIEWRNDNSQMQSVCNFMDDSLFICVLSEIYEIHRSSPHA